MLKMIYLTLPSLEVANAISTDLIKQRVAACTNAFPIIGTYRWDDEIKHNDEVVLIVKTKEGHFDAVVNIVKKRIDYTNCIAELSADHVNAPYWDWLKGEVS